MSKTIQYLPTGDIKPHPLNASIYGDGADKDLLESVRKIGIMSPIIITKSNLIISGHRRFNAAQMAELKEVPVIVSDVDENDILAIEELLIEANRQRQKTPEQIAREYIRLKEIEEEKAKKRMLIGKNDPQVNSPEGIDKGQSRDIAAKKIGIGGQKAERSAKVIAEIDTLKQQGQLEKAEQLRKTLNEKSVNAAWNAIKEKKEAPRQEEQKPEEKNYAPGLGLIELGNQENHIAEMRKAYSSFISGLDEDVYNELSKLNPCPREIENWMDSVQGIQSESPSSGWYSVYDRLRLMKEAENEKIKMLENENKALREQAKRDHDDYEKFCEEFNALVDEKKTLEAKILELSQEPSATTEAKPIQANEIQEKEIFYSTKQKAKYWYEKDGDSWVIIKLWANGEREITITLSSEDEAKKAMKRKITSNYLVREGEISKAEPDTKAKEEIERLRKERSEMYLQIADLEEKVLELKETSSPKARDFQEQEAKIKKLNKENQDIYNEFNKMRDEYHSEKKRNMFLAAQVQLFKEDLARIKKDYGIEE